MEFDATSYSTEWAVQSVFKAVSFGSLRHLPSGKDMLDAPKSVRSKMTTWSLLRSCMCIADTPTLERRRVHLPPAAFVGLRRSSCHSQKRKERILCVDLVMGLEGLWLFWSEGVKWECVVVCYVFQTSL